MSASRKTPTGAVKAFRGPQRERHEPDYLLLVSIVALASLGILMVYSSSGVTSLLQRDDPFAIVGPQAMWAVLGAVVMVVFMRLDYRYLRLVSVAGFVVSLVLLGLVLLPGISRLKRIGDATPRAELAMSGL